MSKLIDLTGQRFGRLVVLKRYGEVGSKWVCKCDCGNTAIAHRTHLILGDTTSCGCYRKEVSSNKSKTHGEAKTRLHNLWCTIRERCSPYGAEQESYYLKGIRMCEEWNDYTKFRDWALANGYDATAPRGQYTIDRIDNNGNYEPSNCRFVTHKENCRNNGQTLHFTINGVYKSLPEWCEIYNTTSRLVRERMKRGWDVERALSTPPRKLKRRTNNGNKAE